MLLYHNHDRLRILLQMSGSVFPHSLQAGLVAMVAAMLLSEVHRWTDQKFLQVFIVHHYAAHAMGIVVGFAVAFRTNLAWARYWEACVQTQFMFSKWGDAFAQVCSFINVACDNMQIPKEKLKTRTLLLTHYRFQLAHWFSLLSGCAISRLISGDMSRMGRRRKVGTWGQRIATREDLRWTDVTGYCKLPRFVPYSIDSSIVHAGTRRQVKASVQSGSSGNKAEEAMAKTKWGEKKLSRAVWDRSLGVVTKVSGDEIKALEEATDRVSIVLEWVNEGINAIAPSLDTPPPILSRCYQELSNGMLGFNQAVKLADVPFPFAYAQLLELLLLVFTFVAPLYVVVFTGGRILSPLLTFVLVIAYHALNNVAKEIENPFGEGLNQLPLVDGHERFVELVIDIFHTSIPQDQRFGHVVEEENMIS